ncbi:Neuropeptide S, partial [Opisthocomus hoazin]
SLCRLNFAFILWISMTFVCSGYPVVPSMVTLGALVQISLLALMCFASVSFHSELAFLKPYLEMPLNKRSFRNGVGSGIKKTSFRRAKS